MPLDPLQALRASQAVQRLQPASPVPRQRLVFAGATGVLGNEVLRRLVGLQRHASVTLLAREPISFLPRGMAAHVVPDVAPRDWPALPSDAAVVMFEPPRLYYDRERALWTPEPAQLVDLARWLRSGGARSLAIVLPHAQGKLPEALKRGLADLDEQAVAALGFERLVIVRAARKPASAAIERWPERLAAWMLSVVRFMVPASEQPVRAVKVAQLVAEALEAAPPGIHVAPPELVWRAAQGDVRAVVREWLGAGLVPDAAGQIPAERFAAKSGP